MGICSSNRLPEGLIEWENMVRNKHNTPGIVKFSFWKMTAEIPGRFYTCVSLGRLTRQEKITDRSICIDGDIGDIKKIKIKSNRFSIYSFQGTF